MRDCPYCDATAEYEATLPKHIDIVIDGPPGPECGRFVEIEDDKGASIRVGEWVQRPDGYWVIRFDPRRPISETTAADAINDIRKDLAEIAAGRVPHGSL